MVNTNIRRYQRISYFIIQNSVCLTHTHWRQQKEC